MAPTAINTVPHRVPFFWAGHSFAHSEFRDPLRFTDHRACAGEKFFRQACRKGLEGVIAKRVSSAYVSRRSHDWLKFKCWAEQEFVIGGFTDPKGGRPGFGALLLGYYEGDKLIYAGKVGTGFDRKLLTDLKQQLSALEIPSRAS